MAHDPYLDETAQTLAGQATENEPKLVAGTVNRVSGIGDTVQVWAVVDGFEGYEWGPLEHRPFAPGETPLVGARVAIGVYNDEKWLVGVDETATLAATWYTFAGAPDPAVGEEGDLALDKTNLAWYGPKHLGAWGSAHTLVPVVIPLAPHAFLMLAS